MSASLFTVIIPVYGDLEGLQSTVANIQTWECRSLLDLLVVVDGGFQSEITEWLESKNLPFRQHEKNKGSYAARNTGIAHSHSPYLLFMDAGVTADPDWFSAIAASYERNTYIGFNISIKLPPKADLHRRFSVYTEFQTAQYWEKHHFAPTAFLWIERRVFEETGLFYEELRSGGDVELGNRCWHSRYDMHFVQQKCIHHPPRCLWAKLRKQQRVLKGHSVLLQKFPNRINQLSHPGWRQALKNMIAIPKVLYRLKAQPAYQSGTFSALELAWCYIVHHFLHFCAHLSYQWTNPL